jgi:cell division initiation protein
MISPLELKNKEFSVRMRGYDRNEVDDFLGLLIGDYEALYRFYRKNSGSGDQEAPEMAPVAPVVPARPAEASDRPTAAERVQARAQEPVHDMPAQYNGPDWDDAAKSIKDILAMAQKAAEDARSAASKEAAAIISEATREAGGIAKESDEKIKAAERRLADLSAQESALRARMKGFLEVYRQLIEDFEATSGIDYSL